MGCQIVGANIDTWLIDVKGKLEAKRSASRQKSALPWRYSVSLSRAATIRT
jgi:hypothetical protein